MDEKLQGLNMAKLVSRAIQYGQGIIGLKKDDIILAAFPKSGSTWVRFFFCNLISICEWNGKPVDFSLMDGTMPELGVDNLIKQWPHRTIPRIVKTHKNCWPIFRGKKSIFLVRNPFDVMASYFHYETARKYPRFTGGFSDFIRHRKFGLEPWFENCKSWISNCTGVFQYESLRKSTFKEFERIMHCIGIPMDEEIVKLAIERSCFDNIRSLEQKFGFSHSDQFQENFRFTRQGKSGTGKQYFSDKDIVYYQELKKVYDLDLY
jgi:hypothetical protein